MRLATHYFLPRTLQSIRNESLSKSGVFVEFGPDVPYSSFLDHMPAGNAAVTRPYRSPPKLNTMGTWYCRRHKTLFSLQKSMQNCCRPQEKRRVTTHWMEQCQRKQVIHWMGQCQCRSPEYTGSEMLSAGVHSHCLVESSPACSAASRDVGR